jgi:hypothetical protein
MTLRESIIADPSHKPRFYNLVVYSLGPLTSDMNIHSLDWGQDQANDFGSEYVSARPKVWRTYLSLYMHWF